MTRTQTSEPQRTVACRFAKGPSRVLASWIRGALVASLALASISCSCTRAREDKAMSTQPRIIEQATIRYEIAVVPESKQPSGPAAFSPELTREIIRYNIPAAREVWFDGNQSRVEEVNVDYGFKGRAITISRGAGQPLHDCKELQFLRFCVVRSPAPEPIEEETTVPRIEIGDETREIAGHVCRRARYETGNQAWHIWFSEALRLDDPTGAVIARDGIPGAILEIEEIPVARGALAHRRTTVTAISTSPVPAGIFQVPPDFEQMQSIEEARAVNRQRMEAAARAMPRPGDAARARFTGWWRLESRTDVILLEVTAVEPSQGDGADIRLQTHNLNVGKVVQREGSLRGEWIVVDEPPGFTLYALEDGDILRNLNHEVFRYRRMTSEEATAALSRARQSD